MTPQHFAVGLLGLIVGWWLSHAFDRWRFRRQLRRVRVRLASRNGELIFPHRTK